MSATDRLIVALDVPTVARAEALVAAIGDGAGFYKIGYQLAFAGGLELARDLVADGRRVFLDMKLLDIDNTVARGVEAVAAMGVHMLTVHAYPRVMAAAAQAARGSDLCVLAVTVLTSMDDEDLRAAGYRSRSARLVGERAAQAKAAGVGGLVASAREAATIRQIVGAGMNVVTPGIRPAGADAGDQKRIMTPADAIAAGASHLVVGRPIVAAADPAAAARMISGEIQHAMRRTDDG